MVAEAEAALSTVDSEFGRTTDPVRMYMREMGTVELLTREGEIEIAKRIEDGSETHDAGHLRLPHHNSRKSWTLVDKVEREEIRIDDFVDGVVVEELEAMVSEPEADSHRERRRDSTKKPRKMMVVHWPPPIWLSSRSTPWRILKYAQGIQADAGRTEENRFCQPTVLRLQEELSN